MLINLLICLMLISCSVEPYTLTNAGISSDSEGDSAWNTAEDGTVILENSRILFELDAATTHFKVNDLKNGTTYYSVPSQKPITHSNETANRVESEITLKYYDDQSKPFYMYSANDSVANNNYTVKHNNEKIRVTYTFGSSAEGRLVPQVFKQDFFKNEILEKLDSSSAKRRITRYYILYSPQSQDKSFNEMAKQYPVLKKQPLYILDSTLSDLQLDEISEYMEMTGYTKEKYNAHLKELKIEDEDTKQPAGFKVAVEYTLNKDGFAAEILTDHVTENSKDFTLQQIDFLEYFSSFSSNTEGYFLVPDGVGALIKINDAKQGNYVQSFYGNDISIQSEEKTQISKNALFPVFGTLTNNIGILGIVENAAEVATLNAKVLGEANPQNNIFTTFNIREMDITNIGQARNIPIFNLYNKQMLKENPKIRFIFIDNGGNKINASDLAIAYRQYLMENGILNRKLHANKKTPLYLDYLCMISDRAQFLGISYDRPMVLSTIDDIIDVQKKLKESGIGETVVRLNGYGKNGLSHNINSSFYLHDKVGNNGSLESLINMQNGFGGELYLDADFQFVYKDTITDNFNQKEDTSQYLNRSLVRISDYNRITRKYSKYILSRFYVSPLKWRNIAESFLKSLESRLKTDQLPGLSYTSAGTYLGGDYSKKRDINRVMAADYLCDTLKIMSEKTSLMTDSCNSYVFPYMDHLVNVPMFSSAFDVEHTSFPFLPIVLHGYIDYAGSPYNLSTDSITGFLRTIEYGASIYFTWITGEDSLLKDTEYVNKYYSLNAKEWLEEVTMLYKKAESYWNVVRGATISDNFKLLDDVFCTVYENGVKVIVNYSSETVKIEDVNINGHDFHVKY